jgi:hypothetical protein
MKLLRTTLPPLAQDRLKRRPDGRVFVELRKAWRDATTHLLLELLEFLEKLAALTPRPEVHLLLYHLAITGRSLRSADARGRRRGALRSPGLGGRQPYQTWDTLMHRAFGLDVLARPHCGGRLRLIATISDPRSRSGSWRIWPGRRASPTTPAAPA